MPEKTNVYAAILAGGSGSRMGNPEKPKQFYMLGSKPILIHTLEKFCVSGEFDKVLVLSPENWMQQTKDLVARYCAQYADNICVVAGGDTRTETVMNALVYLQENGKVDAQTIIVTHDAVRPFVTHRIIRDNVAAVRKAGACDTVVPATDTIVEAKDGETISSIPNRRTLYQGQTPQSFYVQELTETLSGLTDEEKATLTDACKIYLLRNKPVVLVMGEVSNMKITFPQDMRIAESLIGE